MESCEYCGMGVLETQMHNTDESGRKYHVDCYALVDEETAEDFEGFIEDQWDGDLAAYRTTRLREGGTR